MGNINIHFLLLSLLKSFNKWFFSFAPANNSTLTFRLRLRLRLRSNTQAGYSLFT